MRATSFLSCAVLAVGCASVSASAPSAPSAATAAPAAANAAPPAAATAAPPAAATAAPPAAASAAPAPATAATSTPAAAGSAAAEHADLVKFARSHGYKSVGKDDKQLWCKNGAPIGSRLEHTVCVSEASLAELRRTYDQNQEDLRHMGQSCSGMACGKN